MSMGRLTKKRTGAFYLTNLLLTVVLFVVLYLLIDGKVLTGRYTTLITLVCVNVILAVSLNLVTGILGQLVLGHAGFMLVGAYASALFTKNVGMALPISFPISLVLAGLLLARGALFLALGLAMGFPGGTPWGRFVVFTALSWAVSMTLYALQQGLSLRFANQAVALVCGIFGSFVGLMALLFPVWVQRCVPWGYYGLLSLVRMEWDEATRWTAFFWRRPEPLDLALLCLWAALFLTVGRTLFVRKEV